MFLFSLMNMLRILQHPKLQNNFYKQLYIKLICQVLQKSAENKKGICSDVLAKPFSRFLDPEKEKVKKSIEKLEQSLYSLRC